eukprot:jgi/Hompol1/5500/HPOL_004478-RA
METAHQKQQQQQRQRQSSTSNSNSNSNSNSSKTTNSERPPLVDLSQDEQWKIINETGVLHKVADTKNKNKSQRSSSSNSTNNETAIADAVLMSIPMTLFHGILDYVVHYQYGFLEQFNATHVLTRQLPLMPALVVFMYATTLIKHHLLAQLLFAAAAIGVGIWLIHQSTVVETFGAMLQTPGLATIWVYLVIQMDLVPALISLLVAFIYYQKDTLIALANKSSFMITDNNEL